MYAFPNKQVMIRSTPHPGQTVLVHLLVQDNQTSVASPSKPPRRVHEQWPHMIPESIFDSHQVCCLKSYYYLILLYLLPKSEYTNKHLGWFNTLRVFVGPKRITANTRTATGLMKAVRIPK